MENVSAKHVVHTAAELSRGRRKLCSGEITSKSAWEVNLDIEYVNIMALIALVYKHKAF